MLRKSFNPSLSLLLLMWLLAASSAFGQGTAFTYQGKLTDGASPANGTYDFEFKLFDTAALGTGTQFGTTQTLTSVAVSGGILDVLLDFGSVVFDGSVRFLEIAVKPTSGSTLTTLGPRQLLSSTPYAIRSLNAAAADGLSVACVNCVTSGQIGSVSGGTVTGTIPVESLPAGSGNYIQNTISEQMASFNISRTGTAATFNATQQFDLGGQRLLSATGTYSLFAGISAGPNTTGSTNSFFGAAAGYSSTTGNANSFFGTFAGFNNSTGSGNTFIGNNADVSASNPTALNNTALGFFARVNAGLINASAIGHRALVTQSNSLVLGSINGVNEALADTNVGIGTTSPTKRLEVGGDILIYPRSGNGGLGFRNRANTNFSQVIFADDADLYRGYLGYIGANAGLGARNDTVEFGSNGKAITFRPNESEVMRLTADGRVGIGTMSPLTRLHVEDNATAIRGNSSNGYGMRGESTNSYGVVGISANSVGVYGEGPAYAGIFSGNVRVSGIISVTTLGSAGATALCSNVGNEIATCSSSLRYKTDLRPFAGGLDTINRLRPIAFTWKQHGSRDIGLAAEEVEKVEPLLVTHNDKGEVEGVKYDRLNVVLVNAVQQQQRAIESLRHENAELKARFAALEQVVQQIKDQQAMIQKRR